MHYFLLDALDAAVDAHAGIKPLNDSASILTRRIFGLPLASLVLLSYAPPMRVTSSSALSRRPCDRRLGPSARTRHTRSIRMLRCRVTTRCRCNTRLARSRLTASLQRSIGSAALLFSPLLPFDPSCHFAALIQDR